MPTYDYHQLECIASTLLEAAGTPLKAAGLMAKSLVLSNRVGHDSHGIMLLPYYVQIIQEEKLDPNATNEVVYETPTMALIDSHWGFGQLAAHYAMLYAIEKARQSTVTAIGVYRLNHIGRLGEFTEMAAEAGLIAFAFTGGCDLLAAPYGGARALWSTNPISVAIPTGAEPFVMDFATSKIAHGKAVVARNRGIELPEGCMIDSQGRITRDPWAVAQGGALLPFGEHKGYAIALMIELMSAVMIGAIPPEVAVGQTVRGLLFIVLDPAKLHPKTSFEAHARALFERVKTCPPANGFKEVLIPGEPERRQRRISDDEGVFVSDTERDTLNQLGQKLGVTLDW